MKILMLCPLISSSSFITTYPFAKILSKKHSVKIMGPLFGKEPYIKDSNLQFEFIEPRIKKPVQVGMLSLVSKNIKRLNDKDYDILHAFKLLPHTAYAAAKIKKKTGKPLIISIDDYDVAAPKNIFKKKILSIAENSYKSADALTVSSGFLKKIYGGEIIYQVANEPLFISGKANGKRIIKKYNLEGNVVIVHAGTLYDFKGIDILIKAVKSLGRGDVKLLLIGPGDIQKYKKIAGKETIFTDNIPMEEIPDYIAASDIYAIPTKETPYSKAEIPAKIFEAMMMKKAIISSRLSDIPLILDNGKCGILTKPGSVKSLSSGLEYLIDNQKIRKQLGLAARKRYIQNYGYKEIEKKLMRIYSRFER